MNPIDRILSVIAPHCCVGCNAEGSILCQECSEGVDMLPSICYGCGKAVRNYKPCPKCINSNSPSHVWIVAKYDGLPKDLLHQFKFEEKRALALAVAAFMDDILPYFAEPPMVTFVPSVSSHKRQRGFEHTELIAKELCRLRGWNYSRVLHRIGRTRQVGANRETRKAQLKGVFNITNPGLVNGKHVLIIDDVVTTGATLEACSRVLKKAGASEVSAVVFARTPENRVKS